MKKEDSITMTTPDQQRAQILTQLLAGQLTRAEAARLLGRSVRQLRRLSAAYLADGPAALVHGNRGRRPKHALDPAVATRVVELARTTYAGFNDHHLTEKLAAEGLSLSRPTVRRLLRAAGQPSPRSRRAPRHRSRRERLPQAGMLLQADGSRHRWLGADQPFLTLVGGIDDATGTVPWALFREQEDAHGYLLWLAEVIRRDGIPLALYLDRHGIFQRNPQAAPDLTEQLAGGRYARPTQFGRTLAELGITQIAAQSPQAKGRVERLWGTLQDRLGSELRLAGATSLAAANQVLWAYLPQFNAGFAVPAAQPGSASRPLPPGLELATVCCFKYTRAVAADNTIRFGQETLQLLPSSERSSYARARVEVQERLDGSLVVYHRGVCVATRPAPADAPVLRARKRSPAGPDEPERTLPAGEPQTCTGVAGEPPQQPAAAPTASPWRPAEEHPWKRGFSERQRTKSQTH